MTTDFASQVLAEAHGAQLRQQAGTARLAAIARCCRPSTWVGAVRRGARAVARLRRRTAARPCCA